MFRFLKDSTINIFSSLILVICTQLFAFPLINKFENETDFSSIILLYSVAIMLATILGNTLNNVRLINREVNEKSSLFNSLLLLCLFMNSIIVLPIIIFVINDLTINGIFMFLFSIILTARYYLVVYFREELEYKKILKTNLYILVGYIFGVILYVNMGCYYSLIFLLGETFGFIFLIINIKSKIFVFNFKLIKDATTILKDTFNLMSVNGIVTLLNYIDRIILLPVLGSTALNSYFIASSVSKVAGIVSTPVNNVILSYIVRDQTNNNLKYLTKINLYLLIVSIPLFFMIKILSVFTVSFLYPNYLLEIRPILNYVVVICIITIINSVIHPFALKLLKSKTILYIQVLFGVIYIILLSYLIYTHGLIGFCIATIGAQLFRYVITNILIMKRGR